MSEEKIKEDKISKVDTQTARSRRGTEQVSDAFVERVVEVRRITKVVTGGRRLAFSALVVVGDREGKVGFATGKSREVSSAIAKATKRARNNMVEVPRYKTTIPFSVQAKHGSSKVVIRSASRGTGVIAGGAVRAIMEATGISDVLSKMVGSHNPGNVVKATLKALGKLKTASQIAAIRGKKLNEIIGVRDVIAK